MAKSKRKQKKKKNKEKSKKLIKSKEKIDKSNEKPTLDISKEQEPKQDLKSEVAQLSVPKNIKLGDKDKAAQPTLSPPNDEDKEEPISLSPYDISLFENLPEESSDFKISDTILKPENIIQTLDLENALEEEYLESASSDVPNDLYNPKTNEISYATPSDTYAENNPSSVSYAGDDNSGYNPSSSGTPYDETNRPDPTKTSGEFYDPGEKRKVGEIIGRDSDNLESKSLKLAKKDRKNSFNPITY